VNGSIQSIYTITNPEKLKRINEMEAWGINEKGKN
jgi:hypothetical protein